MTRDEAHEALGQTMTIDAVIDKIFDDHEAEKKEIARVLKGFDNVPKMEWEKHINELIDILEETK